MVKEALTHEKIDLFRHKILEACTTAKTCAQIANIIGGTNEKVYSQPLIASFANELMSNNATALRHA